MKGIILAGGYATRLWPLTKYIPKALLPIGGKPIIFFIIKKMAQVPEIKEIIIATNRKFKSNFLDFLSAFCDSKKMPIRLVVEDTYKEEDKLGTIRAIGDLIDHKNLINDELLIIAGDNLFEFCLKDFVDFYKKKNSPAVAFCDLKDRHKVKGRYGVGVLDKDSIVTEFQEKPQNPKSSLAATCCYLFPPNVLRLVHTYLDGKNNPDAPGHFISWLCRKVNVYGFVKKELWYDIGSFESYEQAKKDYLNLVKI